MRPKAVCARGGLCRGAAEALKIQRILERPDLCLWPITHLAQGAATGKVDPCVDHATVDLNNAAGKVVVLAGGCGHHASPGFNADPFNVDPFNADPPGISAGVHLGAAPEVAAIFINAGHISTANRGLGLFDFGMDQNRRYRRQSGGAEQRKRLDLFGQQKDTASKSALKEQI